MRRSKIGIAACLAALSLAAGASPAGAAVTIGQLAPGTPPALCTGVAFDRLQATVTSGDTYVVPATVATGTVTSWSHSAAAGANQTLTMKIFRKVADPATYMVVGHDGPRNLTSGLNTFPTSIPVKPGDVLGLNQVSPANTGCIFQVPGDSHLVGLSTDSLGDGMQGDFGPSTANRRMNITAVVTPSNAFTIGGITRNKKKGTGTLTATVPNPGELTASGKGVKAVGAAVISKTVTAPGEVTLTIRAKGQKRRKLNETGKVKVKPKITYTPTGGDPSTQSTKLKLRKH